MLFPCNEETRFDMVEEIRVIEPGCKGRQCVTAVKSLRSKLAQVAFGLDSGSPVHHVCNSVWVSVFHVS